jgi:hypothetical protein
MYSNLLATTYLERGKIPVYFDTEREAIEAAFQVNGLSGNSRVAVIENTLHLGTMLVSEELLEAYPSLAVLEDGLSFSYDENGRLTI